MPTKPVTRLHDMLTEEVSLVDRAANKRKFIVTKHEDAMPKVGAEVTTNADGTLTAKAPQAAAQLAHSPESEAAPPVVATAKAGVSLTQMAKEALGAMIADCIGTLTEAQKAVEGATIVEADAEMDAGAVAELLMMCSEDCEDAAYALADVPAAPAEPAAEGAAEAAEVEMALDKRLEVAKARRVLAKAQAAKTAATLVQKLGRKMKKDRFDRLQQAMALLSSIASEVAPAVAEVVASAEAASDVGKKSPKAPAATTHKSAEVVALEAQLGELRRQLKQQAEAVEAVRKSAPVVSNALAVDARPPRPVEQFSWPMDMNAKRLDEKAKF